MRLVHDGEQELVLQRRSGHLGRKQFPELQVFRVAVLLGRIDRALHHPAPVLTSAYAARAAPMGQPNMTIASPPPLVVWFTRPA
jgi:hypothetical protein